MKRIGFIMLGIAVFAIVFAVALATVLGPLTNRTFSTINAPLGNSDFYNYAEGAPAPVRLEAMATQALAYDNTKRNLDANGNPVSPKRMVIKNADLTIVVKDPEAKKLAIEKMAETLGGFVVSSTTGESYLSDGTKVMEGSVVVRIPAAKLDEALKEIKADTVDIQNETISGQDVTKEYTDVQSRLRNLEATEKKLTEIMDKAEKTEDVLAVFNQLTQIRSEIEVAKGQIQYYEQSVDLSAISVRIVAEETIQPIKIAGWEPQGQAANAIRALGNFLQGFSYFLIWLVIVYIPAGAIIVLLLILFWRLGKWLWLRLFQKKPEAAK